MSVMSPLPSNFRKSMLTEALMTQFQESHLKLVKGQVDICKKRHHLGGYILFSLFVLKIFQK